MYFKVISMPMVKIKYFSYLVMRMTHRILQTLLFTLMPCVIFICVIGGNTFTILATKPIDLGLQNISKHCQRGVKSIILNWTSSQFFSNELFLHENDYNRSEIVVYISSMDLGSNTTVNNRRKIQSKHPR